MADPTQAQKDAAAAAAESAKAHLANAKEQLAKAAEARKQQAEDRKALEGSKPTPTQEENDLAKLGVPQETLEDDGSGPEVRMVLTRQVEAQSGKPAQGYQTRSTEAQPTRTPAPPKPPTP